MIIICYIYTNVVTGCFFPTQTPLQCKAFHSWLWLWPYSISVASFFLSWKHFKRSSMLTPDDQHRITNSSSFSYHPGRHVLLSPATVIGNILPSIWGVSLGRDHIFDEKHESERALEVFVPSHTSLRACSVVSFWVSRLGCLFTGEFYDTTNILSF